MAPILLNSNSMLSNIKTFFNSITTDKNRKFIATALILLLIVILFVAAFALYKGIYLKQLNKKASEQLFMAEKYFAEDNFKQSLNGDGNFLGTITIAKKYGHTTSGNLAFYYTGIAYLRTNQPQQAIVYLKKFKTSDFLLKPITLGALGDAYLETKQLNKALAQYKAAAKVNPNDLTTPLYLQKIALVHELQNKPNEALNIWQNIKLNYPNSNEAQQAAQNIARLQIMQNK